MEQIEAFLEGILGPLTAVSGIEVAATVALWITVALALISKLSVFAVPAYIFGRLMRRPKFEPGKIIWLIVIGGATPVVLHILTTLSAYVSLGLWSGVILGTPWYFFFLRPRLIRRYARKAARKAGRAVAKLH